MSAFDLTQIVQSLHSSKIKARNDALSILSDYSIANIKLSSKEFAALCKGLLSTLQEERDASNVTSTSAQRVTSASTVLHDLIENALGRKNRPKYRFLCDFAANLTAYYRSIHQKEPVNGQQAVLEHCASSKSRIAKILCLMLRDWPLFTHVLQGLWHQYYDFCVWAIQRELDLIKPDPETKFYNIKNEAMFIDLLSMLLSLVGSDVACKVAPLTQSQAQRVLLSLLDNTFTLFKRNESALHVEIMKVVNKLIVVLVAEDILFVHCLVNLGFKILLHFVTTPTESLMSEFLCFVNIDFTHSLYCLDVLTPAALSRIEDEPLHGGTINSQLYSLENIIEAHLKLAQSQKLRLTESDFAIVCAKSHLDWCSLRTVKLASDNRLGWLLLCGLSKTIDTYYKIRLRNPAICQTSTTQGSLEGPSYKKRRTRADKHSLTAFHTPLEFIKSMLESADAKQQLCGMHVLLFYLENLDPTDFVGADEDSEIQLRYNEDSRRFTTELLVLFRYVTGLAAEQPFWALAISRLTLKRLSSTAVALSEVSEECCYALLKLSVSSLKDKALFRVASMAMYTILDIMQRCSLDENVVSSFEDVVNSPIINGPPQLDHFACMLWYSIAKLYVDSGSVKRKRLHSSIVTWFMEAISNYTLSADEFPQTKLPRCLLDLFKWLLGKQAELMEQDEEADYLPNETYLEMQKRAPIVAFLIERKYILRKTAAAEPIYYPSLEGTFRNVQSLLRRLNGAFFDSDRLSNAASMIHAALLIADVTRICEMKYPSESLELENTARDLVLSLAIYIQLREHAADVVSVILSLSPAKEVLVKLNFPFELIEYRYKKYPYNSTSLQEKASTSFLENEFTHSERTPVRTLTPVEFDHPLEQQNYFEYLVRFEEDPISKAFTYVLTLSPILIVQCAEFYLTTLEVQSGKTTSDDLLTLTRLLGEGVLESSELERDFNAIVVACKVLHRIFSSNERQKHLKDCVDLSNYLLNLDESNLLLDEACIAHISTLKLLANQLLTSSQNIRVSKGSPVEYASNELTLRISDYLADSLASAPLMDMKLELFRSKLSLYKSTRSFEADALECFQVLNFVSRDIASSVPAVQTLMEFSREVSLVPYARLCIREIARINSTNSKRYLKSQQYAIMKSWFLHDSDFLSFPYEIYEYFDYQEFVKDNYQPILTVSMSMSKLQQDLKRLFKEVAEITYTQESDLWTTCISKAVPFAYTSDGIRNDIFVVFEKTLGKYYDNVQREVLPLVILDTVKITDCRNECSLKAALSNCPNSHLFNSETIHKYPLHILISPESSYGLIYNLVDRFYGKNRDNFFAETLHFLIRQLYVSSSHSNKYRIRLIKYVICVAGFEFEPNAISALILEICSKVFSLEFMSDILSLVTTLDFRCLMHVSQRRFHTIVLRILSSYLGPVEKIFLSPVFLDKLELILESSVKEFKLSNKAICFYLATIDFIKAPNSSFQITLIEQFLEDDLVESIIRNNEAEIFSILSALFPYFTENHKGSCRLVSLFLKHRFDPGCSVDFQVRVADYLAQHYLQGIATDEIKNYANAPESSISNNDISENNLNCVIPLLNHLADSRDEKTIAFVECAVGVLLHYQAAENGNTNGLFDLDMLSANLRSIALPMKYTAFKLLYPEQNHPPSMRISIKEFGYPVKLSTFGNWASLLCLQCLSSIIPTIKALQVFKSLPTKLFSEIASIIPDIICFYVSSSSQGAEFATTLVLDFCRETKQHCYESIDVIKETVLAIRSRAIEGHKVFDNLYQCLDLNKLFLVLKSTKLSKTALLIFEDYMNRQTIQQSLRSYETPLIRIYESLDEYDFLDGLPEKGTLKASMNLMKLRSSSIERFQHESAALDADSVLNRPINSENISLALLEHGLTAVPMLFDENLQQNNSYEWAWKLNKWDLPCKSKASTKNDAIYAYFHQLQQSQASSASVYESLVSEIFANSGSWLSAPFNCRFQQIGEHFETLGMLKSVHTIMSAEAENFEALLADFKATNSWCESPDSFLELLMARRTAFMIQERRSTGDSRAKDLSTLAVVHEILSYNDLSKRQGSRQRTLNSALLLDEFILRSEVVDPKLGTELARRSTFQAAKTLWAQGKSESSIAMLEELSRNGSIDIAFSGLSIDKTLIDAYRVKWMSDAQFDYGSNLLSKYVKPMVPCFCNMSDSKQQKEAYSLLAQFCDKEATSAQLQSKIDELQQRIRSRKNEAEEIKDHYSRTSVTSAEKKAVQKYYSRLKSQIAAQVAELDKLHEISRSLRSYSVQLYLKCLLIDSKESTVDRFFALMLEQAAERDMQKSIENDLHHLPSFVCVGWVTQLLSRISSDASTFQSSIQSLISRVCVWHPYHSLYNLISLEYHEELATENNNVAMSLRVTAAKEIHRNLTLRDEAYVLKILKPVEAVCRECVLLAEYKVAKNRPILLNKLKFGYFWTNMLPRIPPPTLSLPISQTGYEDTPVMELVNSQVDIATSGLSLPKIMTLALSSGRTHKMLLKHSADDLRQDAIMEQVFEKVNNFMSQDHEARKRKLTIRTYRAVPLGPKAGVIEFVPNTKALIEILSPYHQKHDSMKLEKARDMMKKAQNEEVSVRLAVFQDICAKVSPVLRKYFLHNFRTPDVWFASRIAYTRGIATSSMVGHILGLGDRHCNNILVDGSTGEPVHIDLALAFDQGRRLPIPESVPFRLTRDIVDGFGITETRGLFSKACEHTFQVLRTNETRIISILDVLKWDPLYSWSISPIRMKRLQEAGEQEFNLQPVQDGSEAATAILTVTDKISAGGLSASAAVRELIREATDERNLAVIYCGWCPFY